MDGVLVMPLRLKLLARRLVHEHPVSTSKAYALCRGCTVLELEGIARMLRDHPASNVVRRVLSERRWFLS